MIGAFFFLKVTLRRISMIILSHRSKDLLVPFLHLHSGVIWTLDSSCVIKKTSDIDIEATFTIDKSDNIICLTPLDLCPSHALIISN